MSLESDPVPLWLLYEHEVEAWRATQSPAVAAWLAQQNFKAEKHRVVLLPDSAGGLTAAVGGLGRRQGELSLWHAAGFVERLPARRFRLAQTFSAAEATQLCLGFAYGGYRFDRYRAGEVRSGERRSAAECRHAICRARRGVAAHGARLDQHAGRRFRARRTRGRGAPARRAPSSRLSRMGGRGSARRKFSGHSRRRTRQQRGAAAASICAGHAAGRRKPIRA